MEKVLNLSLIKGFSDRVRRALVKSGVKGVFKKGHILEKVLCKFCPRVPKENIYLNCTECRSKYIESLVRLQRKEKLDTNQT